MGKKKKQFINKKTAASFQVVQRTQNGDFSEKGAATEGSKFVLQPMNYNATVPSDFPVDLLQLPPEALDEPTFPYNMGGEDDDEDNDDLDAAEYDYEKHMRPMGEGGTFYQNPTTEFSIDQARAKEVKAEAVDEDEEKEKLFEDKAETLKKSAIRVTKDFFEALEGEGDEGDFGLLDDDFVLGAMNEDPAAEEGQEEGEEENEDCSDDDEESDEDEGDDDEGDADDEGDDDYDYDEEVKAERAEAAALRKQQMQKDGRTARVIDDQFDMLLQEEYDSCEDIGELDPEDPAVRGAVEDIDTYKAEIEEFATRMERNYGQPKTAMDDLQLKEAHAYLAKAEEADEHSDDDIKEINRKIDEMYPRGEKKNTWDCESILTTTTNTENHPTIIKVPRKGQKQIRLTAKHGLPADYLQKREVAIPEGKEGEEEDEEEEEEEPANLGERRDKEESKAEKKARKEAIKAARREARQSKKSLKSQYSHEYNKQVKQTIQQKAHNAAHLKL